MADFVSLIENMHIESYVRGFATNVGAFVEPPPPPIVVVITGGGAAGTLPPAPPP